MTTRTWVGGGNDQASNPADWSPAGAPQPGDALVMDSGTINVAGNALAGDRLSLDKNGATYTINVSGNTPMNWGAQYGDTVTVNLAAHSKWVGGFGSGPGDQVTIAGPGRFANQNSVVNGTAVIDADVTGTGSFTNFEAHSSGKLEFVRSVAATQSVATSGYQTYGGQFGVVQVDDPQHYHAATTLGFGEIVLKGLSATSYSLQNDMLTLFDGDTAIDHVRLTLGAVNGFGPQDFGVSQTGAGVVVHADGASYKDGGTLLPLHA